MITGRRNYRFGGQHLRIDLSLRFFFIQACHDAKINAYTILKMVGHDETTEATTSEVHRGYLSQDLTRDEVSEIDNVKVPLGSVVSFANWLKR
jgi:hypothetical protein